MCRSSLRLTGRRLRPAVSNWGSERGESAAKETSVVKIPEGESGLRAGNLTEDRIQLLADYWGRPASERSGFPLSEIALAAGVSPATVRAAQRDKRILSKIRERFEAEILYDSVEARSIIRGILKDENEKADVRLKAGRTILEMSGDLKKAGVNVVQNQIAPVTVVDEDDETFAMRVDAFLKERGLDRDPD